MPFVNCYYIMKRHNRRNNERTKMKKRIRLKKARLRLMREARFNAALDSHAGSIQSSLEAINAQLGNLATLSKGLECLDTFAKERLAANSRNNLRVESLKKLFRLAYGNLKFVSLVEVDENIYETLASVQRRMAFLKNTIEKLLNDEGIRPIAPSINDAVSESEHRIVQTIAYDTPECQPGCVAECLDIGFAVHGVVTPAEVTVFASAPESEDNKETSNNGTNH